MPIPRVFVSSTCYDFQEVRQNLRQFILDFSYDPVMSEFGDIFYEYDSHVQDACIKEIEKCQLFILIVGNNYGSIFHKQQSTIDIPDSVTLREFRRAIHTEIPKHIFINKFVHYDYTNYRRALDNKLKEYFDLNKVSDDKVKSTVNDVRKKFDVNYSYANKSYKYIFHFLDIMSELKVNNAIHPFETFSEIQLQLKKQWAGYVYDNLTREKTLALSTVDKIASRIDSIEDLLKQLMASKNSDINNGIDILRMAESVAYKDLEKVQQLLANYLNDIMYYETEYDRYAQRGSLAEEITTAKVTSWFGNLANTLNKYKWSSTIPFSEIWGEIAIVEYVDVDEEVPYKSLLELLGLYNNLPDEEKVNFASTIALKLKPIVAIETQYEEPVFDPDDDIPF